MAARRRSLQAQRLRVLVEFEKLLEQAMRRLTLHAWQTLTLATPVRTGFARANWIPSATTPAPGADTQPGGGEAAVRAQATALFTGNQARINSLANTYRLPLGPTFIVNNVSYLLYLNRGSSAQAPSLFVERAIQQAVDATQRDLRSR